MTKEKNTPALYFLYLLLLFGYVFSKGYYSLPEAVLLLFTIILAVLYLFNVRLPIFNDPLPYRDGGRFVLFISLFLSLFLYGGLYQEKGLLFRISQVLLIFLLALTSFIKKIKPYFWFYWLVFLLLSLLMFISSPEPFIDVFYFLRWGVETLAKGLNPYSIKQFIVYDNVSDSYCYLPGMLYLTLPFGILLKNVRYTMLFAQLAASVLLHKKFNNSIAALLFLFSPLSLFILELGWTDSLCFLLILLVYYFSRIKKYWPAALIMGLFLGTKQYAPIFLPLFWFLSGRKIKYLILAAATGFILVMPFIIWDKNGLYYGGYWVLMSFPFREDGLTFTSLIYDQFKYLINNLYYFPLYGIAALTFYLIGYRKKQYPHIYLYKTLLLLMIFFFFNKFAFVNYYHFLSSILLLVIAGLEIEDELV